MPTDQAFTTTDLLGQLALEGMLAELLAADLSGLDLVALVVDGIWVADHCGVVALASHRRHQDPLALAEGATENATAGVDGGQADAGRLPQPGSAGRPGRAGSAGPGA